VHGRPKHGSAAVLYKQWNGGGTLERCGNESKWRSPAYGPTLYSRAPAAQCFIVPNITLAQITVTKRLGGFNGSIAQWLFRPNVKLAVTASSVRESASAGLRAALRSAWTRYALHSSPPTLKSPV
jgi:hypothetical protein